MCDSGAVQEAAQQHKAVGRSNEVSFPIPKVVWQAELHL